MTNYNGYRIGFTCGKVPVFFIQALRNKKWTDLFFGIESMDKAKKMVDNWKIAVEVLGYPYSPKHDISLYLQDGDWTVLIHETKSIFKTGATYRTPANEMLAILVDYYKGQKIELI